MGLWQFLQQWRGSRAAFGITLSLLLHGLVVAALLWGGKLPIMQRWRAKPGDALIVELPKPEESASAGSPNAPEGPVTPEAPPNAVKTPPAAKPAPPAPPAPPAHREAPAPRQVASAPRPAEPSRPAPRSSDAPRAEAPRAAAPKPAEPPADSGADKAPAPADAASSGGTPKVERVPNAPRGEPGSNQQVAG